MNRLQAQACKRTRGRRCRQTERFADTMRGVVALGAGSGCLKPGGFCLSSPVEAADCADVASSPPGVSPPLLPPLLLPSRRLGISTDRRRPLPADGVGDNDPCKCQRDYQN